MQGFIQFSGIIQYACEILINIENHREFALNIEQRKIKFTLN